MTKNASVGFGDEVLTGSYGRIGIRLDDNAYRIGSRSRLKLPKEKRGFTLNLFFGSVLAVFRHDTQKTIRTPTAVLGVRGTGIYLSVGNKETYLCTCYGDIDFVDHENENNTAHIHAKHHNAITFNHGSGVFSVSQPLLNHISGDLYNLEAIAGRVSPETFTPENSIESSVVFDLHK
ncbi:MAG: FecR domain-containing protein [Ghiorsea sp.]